MASPGLPTALALLDEVQHLFQLQAFQPGPFLAAAAQEAVPRQESLEAVAEVLDALRALLDAVDAFSRKAMGIRLTHLLADSPAPPQLRTLVVHTVTAYAGNTDLLRRRLAATLRMERAAAEALAEAVGAAADEVLALRCQLREGVLAIARQVAQQALPWIIRAGRDRWRPDAERDRLRRARVDLEQVSASPLRIAEASFDSRLRTCPLPDEEPEPEPQGPDRFSLIEID
ncbi:MAG: hypothetical protein RMK29_21260 [Myxococcales bacterium]|nr:hypothetical protein [Myxococcota bacterium]MDW8284240.1 hypothetical protein [Myxococcales bacterium]